MFNIKSLNLNDFQTKGLSAHEYLDSIKEQQYRKNFEENLLKYSPDLTILNQIQQFLEKKAEFLTIITMGAKWCHDCWEQIPKLMKIQQLMGNSHISFQFIGGIMTKMPAMRKPGEPIWKSPPSPPECIDPKFGVHAIPIIYLFQKNGQCIGVILEHPKNFKLELDILEIIQKEI